ncbi:hypothetical protein ACLB2K_024184 [Fragaria x ananassa]
MLKVLFWNARGVGNENFRYAISDLVKMHAVDMLAICEPKVQFNKALNALKAIGFSDYRVVKARVKVSMPGKPDWMLSVIYASPNHSSRASLWPYFDNLIATHAIPCFLIDSHIISSVVDVGKWKPVRASQSGPKVSHLFFADDLMLFAEASSSQAHVLKGCLDAFCALSGQASERLRRRRFSSQAIRKSFISAA